MLFMPYFGRDIFKIKKVDVDTGKFRNFVIVTVTVRLHLFFIISFSSSSLKILTF